MPIRKRKKIRVRANKESRDIPESCLSCGCHSRPPCSNPFSFQRSYAIKCTKTGIYVVKEVDISDFDRLTTPPDWCPRRQ